MLVVTNLENSLRNNNIRKERQRGGGKQDIVPEGPPRRSDHRSRGNKNSEDPDFQGPEYRRPALVGHLVRAESCQGHWRSAGSQGAVCNRRVDGSRLRRRRQGESRTQGV